MGKLHEVLAVEGELDHIFKQISDETKTDFNKRQHLFIGFNRKLEHLDEGYTDVSDENQKLSTTVHDRLKYTFAPLVKLMDATYQKELANKEAKADIKIGDAVIAADVPATFLLNLEKRLGHVRELLKMVPTLPQGSEFEKDPDMGENIYKLKYPEVKFRTAKTFKSKVLVAATKEHPAQVEKWEEPQDIGKFIKNIWYGTITASDKTQMLGRIDSLVQAVKQARQRANTVEVKKSKIGQSLVDFIMG